jgi:putative acetyltransferase
MSMQIRLYREADWPDLLALWIESWTKTRPDIDFTARAPWLARLFAKAEDDEADIFVAEDEKGLLGFVLYHPVRQWLEQIVAAPRAFGSGAAQALLAQAKKACPAGLGLDVNADNARALAFYYCEGFVRTGTGTNPLSGLPIVVLRWSPETIAE